jgi:uncharacterized membrane protein HdeD (DUF308 family)
MEHAMTMTIDRLHTNPAQTPASNLESYYLVRALVAAAWVASAVLVQRSNAATIATLLLVAYPAWDAAANWFDAFRNKGLRANPSQAFNIVVSVAAAAAIAVSSTRDMNAMIWVFYAWAFGAGLAQLITGIRRWRAFGAQWAMILSGAQSMIAGVVFIAFKAHSGKVATITDVAPYAAFGAFYFMVSAVSLIVAKRRRTA